MINVLPETWFSFMFNSFIYHSVRLIKMTKMCGWEKGSVYSEKLLKNNMN